VPFQFAFSRVKIRPSPKIWQLYMSSKENLKGRNSLEDEHN